MVINFLFKSLVLQILFADFAVLGMLAFYVPNQPMSGFANNFVQIFNEAVVLFFIVSLVIFTDFIPSPVDRYEQGYTLLYLVAFNITVNLVVLVVTIVRKVHKACRKFFADRKRN